MRLTPSNKNRNMSPSPPLSRMAVTDFSACFTITGESALTLFLYLCYLSKYLYYALYPLNNFPIPNVRLRVCFKIESSPCIRSSLEEAQPRDHRKGGKVREPLNLLGRKEQ